ncbi:glycosyltransferase family 2 protein [Lactococcus lactis]|uniref:glycosyltransferase family 2 protein n=1 Tax=Lactococcus lactis TaxID=1358 RepID=UPI001F0F1D1E|nr:glycosyltransferase family A protein [Lactococcus lactis]MCH5427898.1 glycosyltransferase family 2 protein [Lactococcus lactis]MCT0086438.1 glycosyltransferase family 2 protein [Lactococcus lactis subsp. lactis]
MIKYSIIIPIYNVEKYLYKSILSVLNQKFKNFELILINDGSTDNSLKIIKRFEMKDSRVKVFDKLNSGTGLTRNYGLDKSSGKYVFFMDPDDYIDEDLLENIEIQTKNDSFDILMFGNRVVDINGNILSEKKGNIIKKYENNFDISRDFDYLLSNYNIFTVWNKIYERKFLIENNISFDDQRTGQDAIFNLKIFRKINNLKIVPQSFYNYLELRPDSAQTKFRENKVFDNFAIAREFQKLLYFWKIKNNFGDDFSISSVYLMINEARKAFPDNRYFFEILDRIFKNLEFRLNFKKTVKFRRLSFYGKLKVIIFKLQIYKIIWRFKK